MCIGGRPGELVRALTLGELISGRPSRSSQRSKSPNSETRPNRPSSAKTTRSSKAKSPQRPVDIRSAKGRTRYDHNVLTALIRADSELGAEELRDAVGGTAVQLRASLKRLVEARLIFKKGQARATRYWAPSVG